MQSRGTHRALKVARTIADLAEAQATQAAYRERVRAVSLAIVFGLAGVLAISAVLPTTHPVAGDVADNRSALLNFDGISYAKGASVLRQLSAWLGEDVFFAGVRTYLDRLATVSGVAPAAIRPTMKRDE